MNKKWCKLPLICRTEISFSQNVYTKKRNKDKM